MPYKEGSIPQDPGDNQKKEEQGKLPKEETWEELIARRDKEEEQRAKDEGRLEKYLEEKRTREERDKRDRDARIKEAERMEPFLEEAEKILTQGEDLSKIIPGAPSKILPAENLQEFLYKGTEKIGDVKRQAFEGGESVFKNGKYEWQKEVELEQKLTETISGKKVIDLGAGPYPVGLDLAFGCGAESYIAVEPAHAEEARKYIKKELAERLEFYDRTKRDPDSIRNFEVNVSEVDMLKFLSELPDNCSDVVILVSGIDGYIMRTYTFYDYPGVREKVKKAHEYIDKVAQQIRRVLPERGRLITYSCDGGVSHMSGNYETIFEKHVFEGPVTITEKRPDEET